jgi:hypothetical protein
MWKLILILLVCTAVAVLVLLQVAPAKEFLVWLPALPIFFGAFGYAAVRVLKRIKDTAGHNRLIGLYLGTHIIKMLFLALLAAFYIVLVEVNAWQFLLTLLVFYLLHLLWETKLFFAYERALKEQATPPVSAPETPQNPIEP